MLIKNVTGKQIYINIYIYLDETKTVINVSTIIQLLVPHANMSVGGRLSVLRTTTTTNVI